jgi:hypothetical protein
MGLRYVIFVTALFANGAVLTAQTSEGAGNAVVPKTARGVLPSAVMQPALDVLKQALGTVRVERWKGPGPLKEETDKNLGSIDRDVNGTLPALLSAADGAPDSVAKVLPAYRNVEALYDVVLRVAGAAKLEAPADQNSALEQALGSLETARRSLGERLQDNAAFQEKRVSDLQAALKAVPAVPVAVAAPVCPTPPPAKKRAKPAVKAAPAPATN